MPKESETLFGRDSICVYLEIGRDHYYSLVKQGLPVKRLRGRLVANKGDLDEWFRSNRAEQGEPA